MADLFNNFYYFAKGRLWIVPPKCASTSIKRAIGAGQHLDLGAAIELAKKHPIVGVTRRWQSRLVAAAHTPPIMGLDPIEVRIRRYWHDSHIRAIYPAFKALPRAPDHLLAVEKLDEQWPRLCMWIDLPPLEHLNKGSRENGRKDWQDYDLSEFAPAFMKDETLWQIACQRTST